MARKNDSPQKTTMREIMRDYLKNHEASIKSGADVNSIIRDMMPVLLEGALDEKLNEELGYSKYDYRSEDTGNRRNGIECTGSFPGQMAFEISQNLQVMA